MNIVKDWNDFWFGLRSARTLSVFRIAFGLVSALWAVAAGANADSFLTNAGVLPISALHGCGLVAGPHIDLLGHSGSGVMVYALVSLLIVSSLSLCLGFQTRLSALATWLLLTSLQNRNPFVIADADVLIRIDAFYLIFAPCGRALSLDRWIQRRRHPDKSGEPELVEAWGQRLIQLQLCVFYACSFLVSAHGGLWKNGTAMFFPLHMPELVRFPFPLLADNAVPVYLLTQFLMATEAALCGLIWVPRLRKYVLTAGIVLTILLDLLFNFPLLAAAVIATYIVFMPDDWIDKIVATGCRLLPAATRPIPR
jgi:hypothetical protein